MLSELGTRKRLAARKGLGTRKKLAARKGLAARKRLDRIMS